MLRKVKSTAEISNKHLRGLKAFGEEYPTIQRLLVSLDPTPQRFEGIRAIPWTQFLEELWSGKLI